MVSKLKALDVEPRHCRVGQPDKEPTKKRAVLPKKSRKKNTRGPVPTEQTKAR